MHSNAPCWAHNKLLASCYISQDRSAKAMENPAVRGLNREGGACFARHADWGETMMGTVGPGCRMPSEAQAVSILLLHLAQEDAFVHRLAWLQMAAASRAPSAGWEEGERDRGPSGQPP